MGILNLLTLGVLSNTGNIINLFSSSDAVIDVDNDLYSEIDIYIEPDVEIDIMDDEYLVTVVNEDVNTNINNEDEEIDIDVC